MCVAYPMKVIAVEGAVATVSFGDTEQKVSLALLEDVKVGEYLIIHAGFALQKLSVSEAEETLKLFAELAASQDEKAERE